MARFLSRIIVVLFVLSFLPAAAPAGVNSAASPVQSAGASGPQLMPPSPELWERYKKGEVTLPDFIVNPESAAQRGIDAPQPSANLAPITGTIKALAVLVKFSDKANTVTASFFDSLIFAAPVSGRGSVRDYYSEVSYGQVDIVTVNMPSAIGWKTAPQTLAYYANNNYCINGTYPNNCQKLAEDIVDAVNSVVNFADYDNNNDGVTEPIMLVHAGRGAEYTGSHGDIWSHSWSLNTARNYDGKTISKYVIMPEYWSSVSAGTSDMTIGVFAHEMGHGFWNLPDLYDRDNSSEGIGNWSLMASGSWNGTGPGGDSPAWPDAWTRIQMGFTTPTLLTTNQTSMNIPKIATASTGTVFKLQTSIMHTPQEYFLFENRQLTSNSYDQYLPGSGLLIWHVDETKNTYTLQNDKECKTEPHSNCPTDHYLVALEQADGLRNMENGTGNRGDAGDPFPGSTTNRNWTKTTNPEVSSWYTTTDPCIRITNISNSMDTMTADVTASCATTPGAFSKTDPANSASGVSASTALTWAASSGAVSYDYCIDDTINNACNTSWVNTTNTTVNPSGLVGSHTYEWQVRANNPQGSTYANGSTSAFWTFTTGGLAVTNVRVSNVGSDTFTVSWLTSAAADGHINYGTTTGLGTTGNDDRGSGTSDDTHYVTLTGLTASTPYYFDVISGGITNNNGGGHFTVTTGAVLGAPTADNINGMVYKSNGSTPATGAIVYVTLSDGNGAGSAGSSALLSALVDGSGAWTLNLGKARTSGFASYFGYSASGDKVTMDAYGAADGFDTQTVDTANDAPAASMTLNPCMTLAVNKNISAGGTVTAAPGTNCPVDATKYMFHSVVRLTATPSTNYIFGGWTGAYNGSANPYDLTIDGPKSIMANFTKTGGWGIKLPFILRWGPKAGYWMSSNTAHEFWVTPDQVFVDQFTIYISVPGCGTYRIYKTVTVPISYKSFSFTGSFYGSGTFSTFTTASITDGLSSFYISGCGYITGGPFTRDAFWIDSSQPVIVYEAAVVAPDTGEPAYVDPDVVVEKIDQP